MERPGDGGAELSRMRQARGWTQEQLADEAGVSARTIRYLERGQHRPHSQTVGLLAAALGVDGAELLAAWGGHRTGPPLPLLAPRPLRGREDDLRRLTKAAQAPSVVVVSGPGGVGKTALCLHWMEAVKDQYPDGLLYVDLHGFDQGGAPLSRVDGLRRLLSALGEDTGRLPEAPEDLADLCRALTADRRLVVLLDNAASSEQVRALLPRGSGCTTLVTSRRRLDGLVAGEGAHQLPLAALELTDAVDVLAERAPAPAPREQLAALALACARLPLALVILAARLERHPDRVLRAAADGRPRLDLLEVEDSDQSVRQVLAATVRALPEPARSAVDLLGLWPRGELDPYAGAALLGVSRAAAVRVLDSLVDLHLMEEREQDRYALHDLVAAYLGERAAALPAGLRDAAKERLYRYHLAVAVRCSIVLQPQRTLLLIDAAQDAELPDLQAPDEIARWYSAAQPALTAVIRQAQRDRAEPYNWQLPYVAATLFRFRGPRAQATEMLEGAVAVVPAGDPLRPRLLSQLGVTYGMSGRLASARACWEEAVDLGVDEDSHASYLTNMAIVDAELGDHEAALRGYAKALALRRSLGDPRLAYPLVNLARLRIDAGDLDGAAENLTEALQVGRSTGESAVIAASLLELGRVEAARGDGPAAVALLTSALEHANAQADDHQTAEIHRQLAELAPAGSARAAEHLRAAHRLYARIGDPLAEELVRSHADVLAAS